MSTLGKGLESLIPPPSGGNGGNGDGVGNGGNSGGGQEQNASGSDPQRNNTPPTPAAGGPQSPPPAWMPLNDEAEEKLLPAAEELPEIEPPPKEELLPPGMEPAAPQPREEKAEPAQAEQPQSQPENAATPPAQEEVMAAARHSGRQRSESVFYLEVEKIKPNEHQPRRHFNDEGLAGLAASIREVGILQPLVVTKKEKEGPMGVEVEYELIAGERRLMASKLAGLERVPAIVRNVDMARDRLELAVIENIQRENLSPIETGRAFARLQDEFRLTQREIAARLGKSREAVANTMRLLDLPGYIQEAIEKGQISESHGRLLLGVDDPAAQQALFHDLLNNNLTTRELRRRTAFLKRKDKPQATQEMMSPQLKQFEERLASALAAPVKIHPRGEGGNITIDFFSPEELAQILRRLGEEEV